MTRKQPTPMDVYRLLPRMNCAECGEENCLALAVKIANREMQLEECPSLMTRERNRAYTQLKELLRPPIREITISSGKHVVKIGGKLAVYRHDSAYANPTAMAIDVTDEMPEKESTDRIKRTASFGFEFIGQRLQLDMIAVRSTSNDPDRFKTVVKKVTETTDLPLILCSLSPQIIEAGLTVAADAKPLLYGATVDTWKDMADLALRHSCPLTVVVPHDLHVLKSLTKAVREYGVEDLVLDPGTFSGEGLIHTLNNFTMIRRAACDEGDVLLGFPIMSVPMVSWTEDTENVADEIIKWREAYLAAMLITRYADLTIMHTLEGWALLPIVVLRQNIYTDPRKPMAVLSGLRVFGNPDENSPVMFTTNFALTYYTVAADLESAKIDAYLLVVDTGGIAVDSAVAGRKLTPEKIVNALKASGVEGKVNHRKLLIPGKAVRLAPEIEELSQWNVLVGPKDSSGIADFLMKNQLSQKSRER
jgi:acetyl-CoA decarbonylase/synthase complex subunit gamma